MESDGIPDVTICYGIISPELQDASKKGVRYQAAPGVLHLIVDRVARYLIRDGKEIVIDRDPEANDDDVRLFRFGSAFDSLIHPRGILALHGSVIVVGSGCVVFLGHSGAGKSTLTNAFRNTSHSILADDSCATVISESGAIEVLPAYQVIVNALRPP